MKLYISSDHAGLELKQHLVEYLFTKFRQEGSEMEIVDKGPFEFNKDDDYPDYISLVGREVSKDPKNAKGIVIGLSGQGEALVANRFKNVRAGVYYGQSEEIIKLMREHNDSNVLSLGAKFVTPEQAERAVDIWLETPFSEEERHKRRIAKIEADTTI
jgi:ribose 5-phosphate isomerase B